MKSLTAAAGDIASILRVHIIAIAMAAALTFGWILTEVYAVDVMLIGGFDWLLINLLNRVTDLKEDLLNGIRGTERIAKAPNLALGAWIALLAASFVLSHLVCPELTPWRIGVQLVGVGYSYRIVPTLRGPRRFKDLYFFKNFMSAMLFVTTVFMYPILAHGHAHLSVDLAAGLEPGWHTVIALGSGPGLSTLAFLVAFFVPFEITYEILYDMRDLEGDRAAGVPTYPVVHGLERSAAIIDALLLLSGLVLVAGFFASAIGLRELLMLAAPAIQFFFYRTRYRRGITTAECIGLTWLGAGLLLFWLLGTWLWTKAGLTENIYFG